MSRGSSFLLAPWQDDFIAALAGLVAGVSTEVGGSCGNVVLVFPHSRPARYLMEEFRKNPSLSKPMLLPRCLTVSELMGLVRTGSAGSDSRETPRRPSRSPRPSRPPRPPQPPRPIGLLDQVGLLHQVLEKLRRDAPDFSPLPSLPLDDFALFLPWGVRLAALLEDCWLQNQEPESFRHLEGEVQPYAAILLASLRAIQNAYSMALRSNNWTTPGFDAINAARIMLGADAGFHGLQVPEDSFAGCKSGCISGYGAGRKPELFSGKKIILAGFYQLDESAEVVFRSLWKDYGALVCLHSAPSLLDGVSHPACMEHAAWAKRWGAGFELFHSPGFDGLARKEPEIRIWEGYDLHSELEALRHELELDATPSSKSPESPGALGESLGESSGGAPAEPVKKENPEPPGKTAKPEKARAGEKAVTHKSTAVILPDTSLIMPTLHSLPDKDVNISMGYPLEFSALARLLEIIMRLRENAREEPVHGHEPHPSRERESLSGRVGQIGQIGQIGPAGQIDPGGQIDPAGQAGQIGMSATVYYYYWKDLQELYRHPLLRFLRPCRLEPYSEGCQGRRPGPVAASPAEGSLGLLLQGLEKALLAGQPYADPEDLLVRAMAGQEQAWSADEILALKTLHQVCIRNFRELGSAAALAEALAGVTTLLREWGQGLWESFPIDAECLYRLLQKIIPDFAHSALKDKFLPDKALFGLLRQLIAQERAPFEGEPLGALQVIGFLESRLLSFKRVFILDATEDRLPGAPGYDPLLPEALRNEMGLSNLRRREDGMAHNFWRLLAGAEEVVILTRSAQNGSGLLDERKVRSRFVEELIWRAEQKKKALLAPTETFNDGGPHFKRDGPLRVILGKAESVSESLSGMPKSPELLGALFNYLNRGGISATFLDSYLSCPFRFAMEKLCGLRPCEGVNEDDDPAAVGQLIHGVLHEFFRPYIGKQARRDQLDPVILQSLFLERLDQLAGKNSGFHPPADSLLMLRRAGPERLRRMLANGPEEAWILHLEHTARAELSLDFSRELAGLSGSSRPGGKGGANRASLLSMLSEKVSGERLTFDFYGVIDRIDRRGEDVFILDYKTGHIPDSKFNIWEDDALWRAVRDWRPGFDGAGSAEDDSAGDELFQSLAVGLDSLQMPLYLFLMRRNGFAPKNAFWVELSESGLERPLFSSKMDEESRVLAYDEYCPDLLRFILRHMLLTPTFFPRETPACRWCSFSTLCKVNF